MPVDPLIILVLVLSVTIHEFSHAWTATILGDPTAKYMGRLSLNPLAHLDPIGTLMLFLVGFGWGRPVPFRPEFLKNPRFESALIALSGPLSNLLLAFLFTIPYRFLLQESELYEVSRLMSFSLEFFKTGIQLNLMLMIFNLIPLPPLDGSKVFSLLLPQDLLRYLERYQNYGYLVLLLLIFSKSLFGIDLLGEYILYPLLALLWNLIV